MNETVLERYKKHEYNTIPMIAALITIAEILDKIEKKLPELPK